MALNLIGLGLGSIKDITIRGLDLAIKSDVVYLERYTSAFLSAKEEIENAVGKPVKYAFRKDLEDNSAAFINEAKQKEVTLLVVGDVFSATTHFSLYSEAKKAGVKVIVVNNASVLNGVGIIGLELYKYGKTTSIPFAEKGSSRAALLAIQNNKSIGLHTLCLLDLDLEKEGGERYMNCSQAAALLLEQEAKEKTGALNPGTVCVAMARLGQEDSRFKVCTLKELLKLDMGKPLHCIIIPADEKDLHFTEKEALAMWK